MTKFDGYCTQVFRVYLDGTAELLVKFSYLDDATKWIDNRPNDLDVIYLAICGLNSETYGQRKGLHNEN